MDCVELEERDLNTQWLGPYIWVWDLSVSDHAHVMKS